MVSKEPTTPNEQFELGMKYCEGEGVQHDFLEGAKWFRRAAD